MMQISRGRVRRCARRRGITVIYLAMIEQVLFFIGLLAFLVSLAMYAGRTRDFKSLLVFWQPTISFSRTEFLVNRSGLTLMLVAVAIRMALYFVR